MNELEFLKRCADLWELGAWRVYCDCVAVSVCAARKEACSSANISTFGGI